MSNVRLISLTNTNAITNLLYCLSSIEDYRRQASIKHVLPAIVAMVIIGIVAGCTSYREIEEFCIDNDVWLRSFLNLADRIPSHDTIGRVFDRIHPLQLQESLLEFMRLTSPKLTPGHIGIDGKCLRANRNYAVFSLVRAFDLELGLPLSQAPINDKSNEIPASKEVLQRIDVQGKIVSLDAMGAQRAIARKIIEGGGDYVLALKGNQPALHEDVSIYLNDIAKTPYQDVTSSTWETLDKDHGRIEKRQCLAVKVPKWLSQRMRWRGLKSLIRLESQVYRGSTKSTSIRYYISSLELHACEFMRIIRDHWRIEMIHWHLDNNLLEDRSTIHGRFSSQNFSSLRAFALYALRASAPNCSIKILCQRAMRQPDLILKVLDLQRN